MIADLMDKIINADCLTVLKQLPDKSIDLILTDPPYGINVSKSVYNVEAGQKRSHNAKAVAGTYKHADWDSAIPAKEYFDEMERVAKHRIIFGGNYFTEYLKPSSGWIFWDKNNGSNDFGDGELAWTDFNKAIRKYQYTWNGMLQQDMKNKEVRIHPTQKPVGLLMQILRDYSDAGWLVMDPFSGSGSTAIACERWGLPFICVERDIDYYKASVERLNDERKQLNLFNGRY
ncbi:MAG: site-specific DNA-methyltransferase [Alphaproteobacteria bacterium]|nr:site-specific DNA-methyltransferase [Alphaproteobacteria bacterium]